MLADGCQSGLIGAILTPIEANRDGTSNEHEESERIACRFLDRASFWHIGPGAIGYTPPFFAGTRASGTHLSRNERMNWSLSGFIR